MPRSSPERLLRDIRYFASLPHSLGSRRLESRVDAFHQRFPGRIVAAEQAQNDGHALRETLVAIEAAIGDHGLHSPRVQALIARARHRGWSRHPDVQLHLRSLFERSLEQLRRRSTQQLRINYYNERSDLRPGITSSRIDELPEASEWTLVIDETGSAFRADRDGREGRLVGVVMAQPHRIQPRPTFHATESSPALVDEVLQELLDAEAGIFGITREAFSTNSNDSWQTGVLELIEWVIRLLPESSAPMRLQALVEERTTHRPQEDWEDAVAELQRQLRRRHSPLAGKVELSITIVDKAGHPLLPYADAVAYTWGSEIAASHARLNQSGLRGTCLIERNALAYADAWDQVAHDAKLPVHLWNLLLHNDTEAIPATILDALTRRVVEDLQLWHHYRALVEEHIEDPGMNLDLLGRQLDWLVQIEPHQALNLRARLAIATAHHSRLTHIGIIDPEIEAQVEALARDIFDEEPQLAALVDLRRIVSATNAFDLDHAWDILNPWLLRPIALPGLRLWGALQSTAGQLHAFRHEFPQARQRFQNALDAFDRLSSEETSLLDSSQTLAYLAVIQMDDPRQADHDAQTSLLQYLRHPCLEDAISSIAPSLEPNLRYPQHILARYLCKRGTPTQQRAYLQAIHHHPERCQPGHPWQLTLFYRAWMTRNDDGNWQALLRASFERIFGDDSSPTLLTIMLCLDAVARTWGADLIPPSVRHAARSIVDEQLPSLRPRLHILDATHQDPWDILETILPFNFH